MCNCSLDKCICNTINIPDGFENDNSSLFELGYTSEKAFLRMLKLNGFIGTDRQRDFFKHYEKPDIKGYKLEYYKCCETCEYSGEGDDGHYCILHSSEYTNPLAVCDDYKIREK